MKILIVSDSHGKDSNLLNILNKVGAIDLFIHLGDVEGSEEYIAGHVGCRTEFIAGNNDYFTNLLKEKILKIGNYTVYLTHGHKYGVYFGLDNLKEAARLRGADIVMFGHTHVPIVDQTGDVIALNPGSISLPRQSGHRPSYILMEIDSKGEAHFTINYV